MTVENGSDGVGGDSKGGVMGDDRVVRVHGVN